MTGQHGGVTDVLGDHRLAQTVAADQDEVAGFGKKVQRQSALDDVAFDLGGPGPIEVGHGFESLDAGRPQSPFQTAARAFGGFCLGELFEDLMRGPASLGGTRQEVIQLRGQGAQADLLELSGQTIVRRRRRLECGRVHRRSPDHAAGHRAIGPAGWWLRSRASGRRRGWRRSRKATEEARGVLRSSASTMARRKAAAPYSSSSLMQLSRLAAGRLALREGQVQKRFALRHGLLQAAGGCGVEGFALELEHRFLMSGIEHQLVAIIGARMAGDLERAIENAHGGIGGHQGQRTADRFRRDGVIVEIEAHIDGLVRTHGLDPVGGEGMQRQEAANGAVLRRRPRRPCGRRRPASAVGAPPDRARARPGDCIRPAW